MTWIIRIVWFILTFALYIPIRNALEAGPTPGFIILIFHLVYFLFIMIVPSNAFVSMWKKRTSNRVKVLIQYMWSLVDDFCKSTNSPHTLGFQIHIMTALYYSVFDILLQSGLEPKLQSKFFEETYKVFNISRNDALSQQGIAHAFNSTLHRLRKESPSPCTQQGVDRILEIALLYATPDDENMIDDLTYFQLYTPNYKNIPPFREIVSSLRYYADKLLLTK